MRWITGLLGVGVLLGALLGGCAGTEYDPNRPAWYNPLPNGQRPARQVLPDSAYRAEMA